MKNFTTNFKNDQMALEYALYMIVGSYFEKAVCSTPLMEVKLHIMYAQEKLATQYFMEEICDRYVEKNILPELPAMEKQKVEVSLVRREGSKVTTIVFEGKGFQLTMRGEYHGKRCEITHYLRKYAWYGVA